MRMAVRMKSERRIRARQQSARCKIWSQCREAQKKRYGGEDKSLRSREISYIPFAIELTEGCRMEASTHTGLVAINLK